HSHLSVSTYCPNEKDRIMRRSAGFGLNLPGLSPIPSHFLEHVRISTPFDGRGIKLIGWTSHYQFRRAVERVGTGTGMMRKSVSAATRESPARSMDRRLSPRDSRIWTGHDPGTKPLG